MEQKKIPSLSEHQCKGGGPNLKPKVSSKINEHVCQEVLSLI